MRVVLVGANGMLGTDLKEACAREGVDAPALDLPDVDITRPERLQRDLPEADWIINCAAYTRVDDAETDRETCFAVNAEGPRNLARLCAKRGIPLLHISTDYVFDGTKNTPYQEDDPTHALSVYGESKLAGERAIQDAGCPYIIARTQSLFGLHGPSFIKSIMRFITEGKVPLKVVQDQVSCPTWSGHLADALLRLVHTEHRGIVHTSSEGACSWFDFARAIVEHVKPGTEVIPVPASTYPRPARRPANSVLDKTRYAQWTAHRFPSWQEGLDAYLEALNHTSPI
ncbi:MAG: dTDP-4-dehydrorhamnose reductase [Kiritimatiellae bacterium]|nr:dTDP-4-dehydrorhamnose reductase [Kiritimatiellia bacterium]